MDLKYSDVYTLSEKKYEEEAEPILRQVFLNDDPFGETLHPKILVRNILYPIWTIPESDLLEAIFFSARKIGDIGCYLTSLTRYPIVENVVNHCYIPLNNFEAFDNNQLLVNICCESVIYSASGSWGLMISHEHHGILGCNSEFLESMKQFLPDIETQIHSWLTYFMEENKRITSCLTLDWLPELLAHIYGADRASNLLKQYSLP